MSRNDKPQFKIITCEGNIIEFDVPLGVRKVEVPLKKIKTYEWNDILKRKIPVHFRELFEYQERYYVESKEHYDRGEFEFFNTWISKGVE